MIIIASAIVGVLVAVLLAVVLLMGPSKSNGPASAGGSGAFSGRSGQQFQAFQTCLKQHGVTLPSGGGFGGGNQPPGGGFGGSGAPPSGGFGGGTGGGNSKFGSAIAACRSLITGGSSSTAGGTSSAA